MNLYVPTKEEATELLTAPPRFRGMLVYDEALPPSFLLERAIAEDGHWRMPRLFYDEVTARVVGSGAFKSAPKERRIELGYGVAPGCSGRGYATEGVKLLVEEAFSSGLVDEVWAETSRSNVASRKVLAKAGFVFCGAGENDEGPVDRWAKKKPNQAKGP